MSKCNTSPTVEGNRLLVLKGAVSLGEYGNMTSVTDPETKDDLRHLASYLVGPAEIAQLLKVASKTINVWKTRHSDFPEPVRRLKSGDIWDVREIRAWARTTGREVVVDTSEKELERPQGTTDDDLKFRHRR